MCIVSTDIQTIERMNCQMLSKAYMNTCHLLNDNFEIYVFMHWYHCQTVSSAAYDWCLVFVSTMCDIYLEYLKFKYINGYIQLFETNIP